MNNKIATAEMAVVGSCLVDYATVAWAIEKLEPGYFEDPRCAVMFQVIRRLRREKVDIDAVTVSAKMTPEERGVVDGSFLIDLVEKVPTALHYRHYGKIVRDAYFERKLAVAHKQAAENPMDEKLRAAVRALWIEQEAGEKSVLRSFAKDLQAHYVDLLEPRVNGKINAVPTGFPTLDLLTGGFRPGQLIVIGADTSKGKTTFALNLAHRFALNNRRVLFFSAEMGFDELVDRIVASRLKMPLPKIRTKIERSDLSKIMAELDVLQTKHMDVVDQGRLAIDAIQAHVEARQPEILFVDYLQQFRPPQDGNRAAFYSWVSDELKALAREKKLIIVATSQFRRGESWQKEREPKLADFKESGGIENAADIAILLHTKDNEPGPTAKYDFIIAKQRNGPTGRVKFVFLKNSVTFEEEELHDRAYA